VALIDIVHDVQISLEKMKYAMEGHDNEFDKIVKELGEIKETIQVRYLEDQVRSLVALIRDCVDTIAMLNKAIRKCSSMRVKMKEFQMYDGIRSVKVLGNLCIIWRRY